jgi:hypothetical protein
VGGLPAYAARGSRAVPTRAPWGLGKLASEQRHRAMLKYEIHPAIGIARVGSSGLGSDDGSFLGPEPGVAPPAKYRDPAGDLKRQAARFRIFACHRDRRGRLLDAIELTLAAVKRLTWTVHLANRKGVAARQYGTRRGLRNNATGRDEEDQAFIIDPGARSISAPGERAEFDTGRFQSTCVPLGEIAMDCEGRLIVLGGHGRSGSDPIQPRLEFQNGHFADNDHWYDDTSDGPVAATIELADGIVVTTPAWVVVGPPDFAPGIENLVTLYDLLFDLGVKRGILTGPADSPGGVSFTRHVKPILDRALGYRWVNRAAALGYGNNGTGHAAGGAGDFSKMWAALADPSPASLRLRTSLFSRLRNPDPRAGRPEVSEFDLVPRLSDVEWVRSGADNVLPLTTTQYRIMHAWASGDFIDDLGRPADFNELLPDALTRVALQACVGAALYPGVEVNGYIMHFPERFMADEPFRIAHDAVRPGEVTQYNAVPWQADFLYCSWEEMRGHSLRRLGWWPAQRPDDVFAQVGAGEMVPWARGLGIDFQEMIDHWDRLGFVTDQGSDATFFAEQERDVSAIGP